MMMIKKMMKSCIFIMILCLLLASCAPDRETDDDKEVNGEELSDQSDDSGEEITVEEEEDPIEDDTAEDDSVSEDDASMLSSECCTYISQDFLDFLLESYFQERDVSALQELVMDQELTEEELEAYADDPVVNEHIRDVDDHGGLVLRVDGDNDGIEDLFVWVLDGGSSGFSSRHFLKGQADGSFQCTLVTQNITRELAFVSYDDTVYLLETNYDYNRKAADGFIINLYQDGEVIEEIMMIEEMAAYEPEIIYQAEGYEEMADKYAEEGRNGFWVDDYIQYLSYETGSAETREDTDEARHILGLTRHDSYYRSDFDNDGEREWCWKNIFYPSNYYTVMHLEERIYQEGGGEESGVELLETYSLEYEGVPLYFWVDKVGDKQVVFLLSYQGLDKEYLYAYLIEGDQTQQIMEIEYTGITEISYKVLTSSTYMDGAI
ncbi:MAG: hypothetical protein K2J95_12420 [Lachnospiraceae bacterium]|nr:hypothetical protein [Lachnospiraceae bacterium]